MWRTFKHRLRFNWTCIKARILSGHPQRTYVRSWKEVIWNEPGFQDPQLLNSFLMGTSWTIWSTKCFLSRARRFFQNDWSRVGARPCSAVAIKKTYAIEFIFLFGRKTALFVFSFRRFKSSTMMIGSSCPDSWTEKATDIWQLFLDSDPDDQANRERYN